MSFWDFWNNHVFLAFIALCLIWGLTSQLIRAVVVLVRGWPPEHLDADGGWKPSEDKQ